MYNEKYLNAIELHYYNQLMQSSQQPDVVGGVKVRFWKFDTIMMNQVDYSPSQSFKKMHGKK